MFSMAIGTGEGGTSGIWRVDMLILALFLQPMSLLSLSSPVPLDLNPQNKREVRISVEHNSSLQLLATVRRARSLVLGVSGKVMVMAVAILPTEIAC